MFRRVTTHQSAHVASLVIAALLAKLAIAKDVAVNGDTGLYIYDAIQILDGGVLMVEYPSRSPVFEHLLALAIWLGDSPLLSVRALMIGISIGLGLAIYYFARELYGHRVGLVSAAIFYFTPFAWVWGVWVKTEQAATLLAILGFIAAVHHIDRERIPAVVMAGIGASFGLAYLVRRVAIVHIGAFALFVLWYRHRQGFSLYSTLTAAVGTLAASAAVIGGSYLLLTRGDLGLAWHVFDVHTLALFESSGQGSLGWILIEEPPTMFAEDRSGLLAAICQKCGTNTASVFASTAFVVLPAAILALVPLRAAIRRTDARLDAVLAPAVIGAPLLYYALANGIRAESMVMLVAAVGVAVVWLTDAIDLRAYWRPKAMLPLAVFLALSAGYLYRDRILYVTYFQDLFPFFAILTGAAAVVWLDANRSWVAQAALALVLISALVAGGVHAYPYTEAQTGTDSHWFTTNHVDEYGADIDARTEPGDRVFTAQPLYLIHSDAQPLADLSRKYYLFRGWPGSSHTERLEGDIAADLRSGEAAYAIDDVNMQEITNRSDPIASALDNHYCPVDAPLYNETGGQLLAHETTGACA